MSFEQLKEDLTYNSTDMGQMGVWIRLEYAHNMVERHKQRVKESLRTHLDGYSSDGQLREAWRDLLEEFGLEGEPKVYSESPLKSLAKKISEEE